MSYYLLFAECQLLTASILWRARLDCSKKIYRPMIAKPAWCKTPCTSPIKLCTCIIISCFRIGRSIWTLDQPQNSWRYANTSDWIEAALPQQSLRVSQMVTIISPLHSSSRRVNSSAT